MKRITVPEPQIDLYNDGFEDHDLLGRAETGKKLSDLVERIDEPLVIALDGAWGSGKSHFLKCWVGQHLKRAKNTTQTVYFDAFKHDYLDDPLIALTGEVAKRFTTEEDIAEVEKSDQKAARVRKLKKSAWAVGKGAARIGLSVATFGATEALSDMGDEIAKAVGDEAKAFVSSKGGEEEASKFWAMHEAKTAAMEGFRLALEELTEPKENGTPTRKLVIVVDELDRCRPDYALQLLEIIKHFFNVPGVHFVLGVNLTSLENSVRARYGAGIKAALYLQKFVSLTLRITEEQNVKGAAARNKKYFEHISQHMGIQDDQLTKTVNHLLDRIPPERQPSLRAIQKIASRTALLRKDVLFDSNLSRAAVAALILLEASEPELLNDLLGGSGNISAIETFFGCIDFQPNTIDDHFRLKLAFRGACLTEKEFDIWANGVPINSRFTQDTELSQLVKFRDRQTFFPGTYEFWLKPVQLNW